MLTTAPDDNPPMRGRLVVGGTEDDGGADTMSAARLARTTRPTQSTNCTMDNCPTLDTPGRPGTEIDDVVVDVWGLQRRRRKTGSEPSGGTKPAKFQLSKAKHFTKGASKGSWAYSSVNQHKATCETLPTCIERMCTRARGERPLIY